MSWEFIADGAVLFLESLRLIPFAAQSKSDRSCSFSFSLVNSVADDLLEKACITVNPLLISGGFKAIDFISWASRLIIIAANISKHTVFFIFKDLNYHSFN